MKLTLSVYHNNSSYDFLGTWKVNFDNDKFFIVCHEKYKGNSNIYYYHCMSINSKIYIESHMMKEIINEIGITLI